MPLRATSCLAENSWPILDSIVDALRDAGVDTVVDRYLDPVDADVVFACGLLTRDLVDVGAPLDVVASVVFPGESLPVYRSLVVTRESDGIDLAAASRATFGVNDYGSWSGWFGYLHHLAGQGLALPVEDRRYETGSHAASLQALINGDCAVAAIDSSVWNHLPQTRGELKVIATTRDWPAPAVSVNTSIDEAVRSVVTSVRSLVAVAAASYDQLVAEADRFR